LVTPAAKIIDAIVTGGMVKKPVPATDEANMNMAVAKNKPTTVP
jgi:hypothetical protein